MMKAKRKLLSLLTSLVLCISLLGVIPADSAAFAASEIAAAADVLEYHELSGGETVYDSDLGTVIEITGEPSADINSYSAQIDAGINTDADFIRQCGKRYGYNYLASRSKGANRQKFYMDLYNACVSFWDQTSSLTGETYRSSSNSTTFYIISNISFYSYGLTNDEALETYSVFKHDNPIFYFLSTTVLTNSTLRYLAMVTTSEYTSASTRKSLQDSIKSFVKNYCKTINWRYTNYYKALLVNNYICSITSYAYESDGRTPSRAEYAHSILGPIKYKKAVCEGYAKLYQLLMNYLQVESLYVVGTAGAVGHAWNIVKLDNGYYYNVDSTWNDAVGLMQYFAKGTVSFYKEHTPYTPSNQRLEHMYTLPSISASDYSGSTAQLRTLGSSFTTQLSNVKAYGTDYSSTTLTWDIPASADGVIVYLYNSSTGEYEQLKKLSHYDNVFDIDTLTPGKTYTFRLCTYYNYNGKELVSSTPSTIKISTTALPSGAPTITRYSDNNRYGTAVKISGAVAASKSDYVIIASGLSYADALAGVPLAHALNAPILLSTKDSIDAQTIAEIKRLSAKKALILGGTGAVSDKVKSQLTTLGLSVERFGGKNRYETSVMIAERLITETGHKPDTAFFVYANGYADALSIGNVAAIKKCPVLYLPANGKLDDKTKSFLAKNTSSLTSSYIIGSSLLIGAAADSAVKAYTHTTQRLYGADRYQTCIKINTTFKSLFKDGDVCVATGLDFPDALAGGVLAAKNASRIMLVGKSLTSEQKTALKSYKVKNLNILGGTGVIPKQLAYEISAACAA